MEGSTGRKNSNLLHRTQRATPAHRKRAGQGQRRDGREVLCAGDCRALATGGVGTMPARSHYADSGL